MNIAGGHNDLQIGEFTRNCLAYGGRSGALAHFHVPHLGDVNYFRSRSGVTLVIGDPVCRAAHVAELIARFIEKFPSACFVQVSEATAAELSRAGFYVNNFGFETELMLKDWQCSGPRSHMLRKNMKKALRAGVEVVEISEDPLRLAECRAVSESWLNQTKGTAVELTLLTRPPVFECEPATRKFAAYLDGRAVGVAFFDPISACCECKHYVFQIVRSAPDAVSGIGTLLLLSAAEQFRNEGVEILSLGLSPLSLLPREPFRHNPMTRQILRLYKKLTARLYNYQGIEFYKSRFGGVERPVFFCCKSPWAVWQIIALGISIGIVGSRIRSARMGWFRRLDAAKQRRLLCNAARPVV
jgi:lysylphosphatidylglycerol synthetase-like protein (DUF2156 family)